MSAPVITLLSDLGTKDASVVAAKAAILKYVPGAVIVDISHQVALYDLQQAAYLLLSAYRHFPAGTIHVVAVDIFAGSNPRLLLSEKDGFYFMTPDNGLLHLALGTPMDNTWLCATLDKPYSFQSWLGHAGNAISTLISGGTSLFSVDEVMVRPNKLQPRVTKDSIECNVLYIDSYGNVVLDITKEHFDNVLKGRPFRIKIMRSEDITKVSDNYNDVAENQPLCLFNDAGCLEIALNRAPAATLLGLWLNNSGNLRYRSIKIFF